MWFKLDYYKSSFLTNNQLGITLLVSVYYKDVRRRERRKEFSFLFQLDE
jgi:hypothetical protein